MNLVLEKLAANYPLLYLDPDKDTQETYRFVSCGAVFLGIKDGSYSSGRLGNYTDEPEKEAGRVCEEIARIKKCIESHPGAQPFDLIAPLMEK